MTSPEEPFTLVSLPPHRQKDNDNHTKKPHRLFRDVLALKSAKSADHDLLYIKHLRDAFPDSVVTAIPTNNIPLLRFAAAGFAAYKVDKDSDSYASWTGFNGPSAGRADGTVAEAVHFAKYEYIWKGERFVLYVVNGVQYVLKERGEGEHRLGPSTVMQLLIEAVGGWMLREVVWVFDNYWYQDKKLYQQVLQMSWDKVILDENMKADLASAADKFFSSRDVYDDLGVPWKRGLLFHGPPGNGKTITIKALMHTLLQHTPRPIPTLYVKSAPQVYHINAVFQQARALAPCMLVLEDIETIVRPDTRSYFFNQMDGLEDNSGLFVVASTNFLDRLDPGLTSRPSRFDRKYLFPLPNEHERVLYCRFWRGKVRDVEFPEKLCGPMASITDGFSFAFLQECFVAALLSIAHQTLSTQRDDEDGGLEQYELWRAFRKQADILRKEIHNDAAAADLGYLSMAGLEVDSRRSCSDCERRAYEEGQSSHASRFGVANASDDRAGRAEDGDHPVAVLSYGKSNIINSRAFEMV